MWSERRIAHALARNTFASKCVVLCDNCQWTGHECDILGVTVDLRVIDVEIKISRSDLKADAAKEKWWHRFGYRWDEARPAPIARQWPPKVWKHYYALPRDIWRDDLMAALPSPKSGVLLLWEDSSSATRVECRRYAKPNRDACRLEPKHVMDIARLANLRMWDAYADVDRLVASRREAAA